VHAIETAWHTIGPVARNVETDRIAPPWACEPQRPSPRVDRQVPRIPQRHELGGLLRANASVVGAIGLYRSHHAIDRSASRADFGSVLFTAPNPDDQREGGKRKEHEAHPCTAEKSEETSPPFPREEHLELARSSHALFFQPFIAQNR